MDCTSVKEVQCKVSAMELASIAEPQPVLLKESRKGRMADALALTGDEGRDKLR